MSESENYRNDPLSITEIGGGHFTHDTTAAKNWAISNVSYNQEPVGFD